MGYKYNKNNRLSKNTVITYTQICTHKKSKRIDFRSESILKDLICAVCKERDISISEGTRLLWVQYLQKRNLIEGFKKKELVCGIDWEL